MREAAKALGREVAIMADLQGPKIRVGKLRRRHASTLAPGATFVLDATRELGDATGVGLDYKELPRDVAPGAILLLDDGLIRLKVEAVNGPRIITRVELGGTLSNNKGINRLGGGLTAPALTAKDMDDMKTAARLEADYLAVSFPKNKEDMYMARQLLRAADGHALLIAKIERAEAIAALERDHRRVRRHHGRARRPRRRGRQRGGAGPAEADDPDGARAQQARRSPRRR